MAYWTVNVALPGVSFAGVHSSTFLRFTEEMIAPVGLGRVAKADGNHNIFLSQKTADQGSRVLCH